MGAERFRSFCVAYDQATYARASIQEESFKKQGHRDFEKEYRVMKSWQLIIFLYHRT